MLLPNQLENFSLTTEFRRGNLGESCFDEVVGMKAGLEWTHGRMRGEKVERASYWQVSLSKQAEKLNSSWKGMKGSRDFFFFFLKIKNIIACLYSDGNTLVESREVKINDAGERARGQLQTKVLELWGHSGIKKKRWEESGCGRLLPKSTTPDPGRGPEIDECLCYHRHFLVILLSQPRRDYF